MKHISKTVLISMAILVVVSSTDAMAARKLSPAEQLSQGLKQAGLQELENEVIRQLGQAIEVGAPLRLDQRTSFPPTPIPIENFQPKKLEFTPETMNQPIEPGDYTIDVMGFCTKWSLHYPGRGLPYTLARLQGRHAEAISALISRGMRQGVPPRVIKAVTWRIQGGVPLRHWRSAEQELAHELIPEYESSLQGDYLEQTREIYGKAATLGKLPRYETMLSRMGAVGETVLELQRARKILANKTLAAERMPDLLYGRPRDGLPRTLTGGPNDPPSDWSEIAPGLFARFTIIKGDLGLNVLDLRITPQARIPSAAAARSTGPKAVSHTTKGVTVLRVNSTLAVQGDSPSTEGGNPSCDPHCDQMHHDPYEDGVIGGVLQDISNLIDRLIGYAKGHPAQALILAPMPASGVGIRG